MVWTNETRSKYVDFIIKTVNSIDLKITEIFADIMDLYTLRKFLDKNYITNVIAYTGISHSCNYIDILVKNFGFKLTHSTNIIGSDIEEMNEFIKQNDLINDDDLKIFPDEQLQCIDMGDFPKNFT